MDPHEEEDLYGKIIKVKQYLSIKHLTSDRKRIILIKKRHMRGV